MSHPPRRKSFRNLSKVPWLNAILVEKFDKLRLWTHTFSALRIFTCISASTSPWLSWEFRDGLCTAVGCFCQVHIPQKTTWEIGDLTRKKCTTLWKRWRKGPTVQQMLNMIKCSKFMLKIWKQPKNITLISTEYCWNFRQARYVLITTHCTNVFNYDTKEGWKGIRSHHMAIDHSTWRKRLDLWHSDA